MTYIFLFMALTWGLFIFSTYKKLKYKEYKSYMSIIVCEMAVVCIITIWLVQIMLNGSLSPDKVWMFVVLGIVCMIHKRLKSNKYKNI